MWTLIFFLNLYCYICRKIMRFKHSFLHNVVKQSMILKISRLFKFHRFMVVSYSIRFQQARNEYVNVSAKPFIVLFRVGQNQTCLFIPSVCPLAVICRYYCIHRCIFLSQKPLGFCVCKLIILLSSILRTNIRIVLSLIIDKHQIVIHHYGTAG